MRARICVGSNAARDAVAPDLPYGATCRPPRFALAVRSGPFKLGGALVARAPMLAAYAFAAARSVQALASTPTGGGVASA